MAFIAGSAISSLGAVLAIVVVTGWLSPIGYFLIPLGTGMLWWTPARGEGWPVRMYNQPLVLTPTRAGIVIQHQAPARPASASEVAEALFGKVSKQVGTPYRFKGVPDSAIRATLPTLSFPCHRGTLRRSLWIKLLLWLVFCVAVALVFPGTGWFPLGLIFSALGLVVLALLVWGASLIAIADVGSFSISPSGVYPGGLTGWRIDWLDVMRVERRDNSVLITARSTTEPIVTQFRGSVGGATTFYVAELVERLVREQRVYHRREAHRQRRR